MFSPKQERFGEFQNVNIFQVRHFLLCVSALVILNYHSILIIKKSFTYGINL